MGCVCICFLSLVHPVLQWPAWVANVLAPSSQLAFLNTDSISPAAAVEDAQAPGRSGVVNAGEAALLMRLVDGLLACGVPGSEIGLVSPYKAQVVLVGYLSSPANLYGSLCRNS